MLVKLLYGDLVLTKLNRVFESQWSIEVRSPACGDTWVQILAPPLESDYLTSGSLFPCP